MQRHVDEFTFRFNHPADEMKIVFRDLVDLISGSNQLSYKAPTAKTA